MSLTFLLSDRVCASDHQPLTTIYLSYLEPSQPRHAHSSTIYTPYRDIFFENQEATINFKAQFENASLEELQKCIEMYQGQHSDFCEIPYAGDLGILRLDAKDLKSKLLPSPLACLAAIQALLPELIKHEGEVLLKKLHDFNTKISAAPKTVPEFVAILKLLDVIKEEMPEMTESWKHIEKLMELMKAQDWPIPTELTANSTVLVTSLNGLTSNCDVVENRIDEDKRRFVDMINGLIPELRKDGKRVLEKLDDPMLADPGAHTHEVCAYLKEQEDKIQE